MKNYLVTGGYGFVGSHLVERLIQDGNKVTVLDNLSNGSKANLAKATRFTYKIQQVEKTKREDFKKPFDGIFHLATSPRSFSINDPFTDIETNCKGMIAMLEIAKSQGAKLVFTSNSGIFGSMIDNNSINETFPNNPTTPYDANKLVSEYYCKIYKELFKVRSTIVRFATVYGERQKVNEKLNWRPLVATFIKNVKNHEEVIINGDGNQTRDLIYVKDAVQGLIKGMESKSNNAETFLISTNQETSVNQVLNIIEEILGKKMKVRYTEPLKGDIRRMKYSYDKAKSTFGYEPKYILKDVIKKMLLS